MLTAQYDWRDQICENVHFIQCDHTVTSDDLNNAMDVYDSWRSVNLTPLQTTQCTARGYIARDLTTEFSIEREIAASGVVAGTNTSGDVPTNSTICMSWRTGFVGRSFRGRTFHIGLAENMRNGSQIDGTAAADLIAAYDLLKTNINAISGFSFVVASRRSGGVDRTALLTTPIQFVELVDENLDSQRRRLPGRGR